MQLFYQAGIEYVSQSNSAHIIGGALEFLERIPPFTPVALLLETINAV